MSSNPFKTAIAILLLLGAVIMQAQLKTATGTTEGWTILDTFSATLMYLLVLFKGNMIQKRLPSFKSIIPHFIFTSLLATIYLSCYNYMIHNWAQSSNYYLWFQDHQWLRSGYFFIMLQLTAMTHYLALEVNTKKHQTEPTTLYENKNKDAELYKLRQQINPHFLFNSLNSINALMQFDKEKARDMIVKLSHYYRSTINTNEQEWHTVEKELENISLYCQIEKIRFGNRLEIIIECEEHLKEKKVPPLLYQPLVENAIKHGLYGITENITITIKIYETNSEAGSAFITFEISNPFDHTVATKPSGTGFGLENIKKRIYLLFATPKLFQTYTEKINDNLSKFIAYISIPNPNKNET